MGEDFTDIKKDHWIYTILPDRMHDYAMLMRMDRPVGVVLLYLPPLWAIILLTKSVDQLPHAVWTAGLFLIGAMLMRGAGCTINDLIDRKLDRKVERTQQRPIADGRLSIAQAIVALVIQLFLAAGILFLFNTATIKLGVLAVIPVMIYPVMKRVTWWPQAFLAIVFNWGVLMASTAMTGNITWTAVALYGAAVFWTFGYDTIYAYQDRGEDEAVGIKSTAILLGEMSKSWLYYIFTMMVVFLSVAGLLSGASPVTIPGIIMIWGIIFYQLRRWDPTDRIDCLYRFKFHQFIGGLIGAVFFLGRIMA